MMKWLVIGLGAAALAGCSRASDPGAREPDIAGNATAGVAFAYGYDLTLPSSRISDLQEEHARACEQLGTTRCRITGLRYTVDSQGSVSASLSVKLAAEIARAFGRAGIKRAESVGATLTGADISGTDVATAAAANGVERVDVLAERVRIDRELARNDLKDDERAQLRARQSALITQARDAATTAADQRDRLASTPMTFTYDTGRGTGVMDRLRDAGDTALASIGLTLTGLLWVVSALGPPMLLIIAILMVWHRWGHRAWLRLAGGTRRTRDTAVEQP